MSHAIQAPLRLATYPPEWKSGEVQAVMYAWAGWRCEHCGMAFVEGSTKAVDATNANGRPVILTVHHLDGNGANCSWRNLLVCCQRCHLHVQAVWKPGDVLPLVWNNQAPEWLTKRHLAYGLHPQLDLFGGGR